MPFRFILACSLSLLPIDELPELHPGIIVNGETEPQLKVLRKLPEDVQPKDDGVAALASIEDVLDQVQSTLGRKTAAFATALLRKGMILAEFQIPDLKVGTRLRRAERCFQDSIRILRRVHEGSPSMELADSLRALAKLYGGMGRASEAEPMHREEASIRGAILGEEHPGIAQSLSDLGFCLNAQEKLPEAEKIFRRALRLAGDRQFLVASIRNNLAYSIAGQGKYLSAEEEYRKCIKAWIALPGEWQLLLATTKDNLGDILRQLGKYPEAERLCREALKTRCELLSTSDLQVARSRNNLGAILSSQGRYGEAEENHREALKIRTERLGNESPDVAISLNNLAIVLARQKKFAEAIECHQRAVSLASKNFGERDPRTALFLDPLAATLSDNGDYAQAEAKHQKALEILRGVHGSDHPSIATILFNLAGAQQCQKKHEEAEKNYRSALDIYQRFLGDSHPNVALCKGGLALLLQTCGRPAEAMSLYQQSLEHVESVRTESLGAERERALLARSLAHRQLASSLAALLVQTGDPVKGFAVIEQAKGRDLLDLLARGDRDLLAEQKKKVTAARRAVQDPGMQLASTLGEVWPDAKPATHDEVRGALRSEEVLLSYVWSWNVVTLIALSTQDGEATRGTVLAEGKAEVDELEGLVDQWRLGLQAAGESPNPASREELAHRLIPGDLLTTVQTAARVIVLPDGPLHQIPFETLLPPDRGPDVAYASSGSVFVNRRSLQERRSLRFSRQTGVLIVGNPIFQMPGLKPLPGTEAETKYIHDLFQRAGFQPRLLLKGDASLQNIESSVESARFLHLATHGIPGSASRPYDACIALTRPERYTAKDPGFLTLDRLIRSWRDKLGNCELAVLSACDTQLGVKVGDSIMALPWGFFYAGAPAVIASLWKVDDGATTLLMGRFYENLLGTFSEARSVNGRQYDPGHSLSKSTALREAKQWLRSRSQEENRRDLKRLGGSRGKESTPDFLIPGGPPRSQLAARDYDFSHPYYWSSFILIGSPD